MSGVFPISGRISWIILFIILSLSSFCQISSESQISKALNWCSQEHCEDCSGNEIVCTNSAVSSHYGDLCGCCHTCVQIRDLGDSCGSQLAVRTSFTNFEDSRSRVTVLATTRCKAGLVCTNFICESSDDRIDKIISVPVERNVENIQEKNDFNELKKSDNFVTNLINDKKSKNFYHPRRSYNSDEIGNEDDMKYVVSTEEIHRRRFTSMPSIRKVPSIRMEVKPPNDEFASSNEIKNDPKKFCDLKGHFVNVIIDDKEFQLIYGKTALIDLQILLNSVNETHSTSIPNEFEAHLIYENFQKVIEPLNSGESLIFKKVANEQKIINNDPDLKNFVFLHQLSFPRSLKLNKLRPTIRFRKKRELQNTEEKNPSSLNSEIIIYDFFNKTPKLMQNSSHHWLIARQVDENLEDKLLASKSSNIEPAINIHITGIPRNVKSSGDSDLLDESEARERRTVTDTKNFANYDDELEIFVTDASTEIPEFSQTDEDQRNSNFTISPIPQDFSDLENENYKINYTNEKYWDTSIVGDKNYRYSDNNYEFIFPENPVILENDDYYNMNIRINETVDEFKSQLDRIENKVVVIESSLYDMIMKIESKERSKIDENKRRARDFNFYPNLRKNFPAISRTVINNQKIVKPEDSNQFIGKYILLPKSKTKYNSNENSTSSYLSLLATNKNRRNFNIEDEGIAQLIPIRSNRQWRTVKLQPNSDYQNILRRDRNDKNIINEELQPRRRKTRQRFSSSEQKDAVRSKTRRVLKDDPIYSTEQTQTSIFSSNPDTKSYTVTKSPNHFFQERHSLKFTTDPSRLNRQVVWPLNSGWNRQLSAERNKRKSEEVNRRNGSNLKSGETPSIEESISILETQIPKSVLRTRMPKDFDKRIPASSSKFETAMMPMVASMRHSFIDDNDWNRNSWDEVPSLNLFVVNGEKKSEFGNGVPSNSPESYENPVLSMENKNSKSDSNWDIIYPAYLDYSDRLRQDEQLENDETSIVEAEATESSINQRQSRQIGKENLERKKRSVEDNKTDRNISTRWKNVSSNREDKNKKKRSKRSVQMVDWLRAAQEYHERLHQVRNAALRTWLASREELADGNLTNVKLFTREIPSYLQKYTPSFTSEDNSEMKSEASHDYPQISTFNNNESFADFFSNQSSSLDNETESKNSSNETDSVVARKFTIIATGNSTIKIEELPKINEDNESFSVDQSSEASSDNEFAVGHQIALNSGDNDDFDHMYESVDAEDEDFDYGDPNFALSRWLDEVDIIDASSVETPDDKTKSINDNNDASSNIEEDYEVDELLSRTKRNTPLSLFKVKGNPSQDVVVWPSNWKDFINRYFQRYRTRNSSISSTRIPKRNRRILKIGPAKIPNLNTKV